MIKGEYRGASLGWLVAILILLGGWALFWGPDGDDDEESPAAPTTTTPEATTTTVPTTTTQAPAATTTPPAENLDGPVVRASPPYATSGEDAGVGGELLYRDGCLLFEQEPGMDVGIYHAIVWPAGTAWDEEAQAVVLADGRRVAIGDGVIGAGGYYQPADLDLEPAARDVLTACTRSESGEVAQFNNQADAARPAS